MESAATIENRKRKPSNEKRSHDEESVRVQHATEVARKERFEFGKNWSHFLSALDDRRIARAETSLLELIGTDDLTGKTFLDIGSGSGLFSLAARRLGAKVRSVDFDPECVACTRELQRRYFPNDPDWVVESGSVLDEVYLRSLGSFDIVYSWGVLHHTGAMWRALDYAQRPVKPGGLFVVALYNDTGTQSERWRWVKRTYGRLPVSLRKPYVALMVAPGEVKDLLRYTLMLRPSEYIRTWTTYRDKRGMSKWHDAVDWVGGYPYEVARPDQVFDFFKRRDYTLEQLRCGGGLGCNEYVFQRNK